MKATVAFGQIHVRYRDWESNADAITRMTASAEEADLLVLPELATSGYDFPGPDELGAVAEDFVQGRTRRLLEGLAKEYRTTIVCGYAENADNVFYNSAMLVTPDGAAVNYRKLHLFNRERDLFKPGAAPAPVVETPAGRVGLMICFDWFFPEMCRSLALRGAQIIAHPSNLVLPWCQRAMFCRSIENRVFTITANRIGSESQAGRTLSFTGASQILGPSGETLAQAPSDQEFLAMAEIDPAAADDKSVAGRNDLFRDRRPELYIDPGEVISAPWSGGI